MSVAIGGCFQKRTCLTVRSIAPATIQPARAEATISQVATPGSRPFASIAKVAGDRCPIAGFDRVRKCSLVRLHYAFQEDGAGAESWPSSIIRTHERYEEASSFDAALSGWRQCHDPLRFGAVQKRRVVEPLEHEIEHVVAPEDLVADQKARNAVDAV